jgi:hypothetical protein
MDLGPDAIRRQLVQVDAHGWDSPAGRQFLAQLRAGIVEPVVRSFRLAGPAADQAVSTGWSAAWDAVRRPSVRTAQNPAGMVWVAVRRAVWGEVAPTRRGEERALLGLDGDVAQVAGEAMPAGQPMSCGPVQLGPSLAVIVDALVDQGWERAILVAAIEELADHVDHDAAGVARARWRWVALRTGVPEWQARRLATALLGVPGHPGVLALVVADGPAALQDEGILRVLRATCRRSQPSPSAHLRSWERPACAGATCTVSGTAVTGSSPGFRPVPVPGPSAMRRPEATPAGAVAAALRDARVTGDTSWRITA